MLLLRNLERKRELCCRDGDLEGLFHAHFWNYWGMSQQTSGLDCVGFFIKGNVLSSLALIFFCYVVNLHDITSLGCCLLKNICSGLETLLCAGISTLPEKQKDKNTPYQNLENFLLLASVPNPQTREVTEVCCGRVSQVLSQMFWGLYLLAWPYLKDSVTVSWRSICIRIV